MKIKHNNDENKEHKENKIKNKRILSVDNKLKIINVNLDKQNLLRKDIKIVKLLDHSKDNKKQLKDINIQRSKYPYLATTNNNKYNNSSNINNILTTNTNDDIKVIESHDYKSNILTEIPYKRRVNSNAEQEQLFSNTLIDKVNKKNQKNLKNFNYQTVYIKNSYNKGNSYNDNNLISDINKDNESKKIFALKKFIGLENNKLNLL